MNLKLIETELEKNRNESEMNSAIVENAKKRMADNFGGIPYSVLASKPKKYRKPFKMRMKERFSDFRERIRIVFGF